MSEKIPTEVLYVRKTALGIRLVKPSVAVETLALKLYIDNKQARNRIANLLIINKELQFVENGINTTPVDTKEEERFWEAM